MKFVCDKLSCLHKSLMVATVTTFAATRTIDYTKKELLAQLIKLNDENIPKALSRQLTEKNNRLLWSCV